MNPVLAEVYRNNVVESGQPAEERVLARDARRCWHNLAQRAAEDKSLPDNIQQKFTDFLKCGLLNYGFLRVRCKSCHHEKLVAVSCKRRGFCPSCGARRMVESALHG